MVFKKDNKESDNLYNLEVPVSVSSNGSYHVKVKDILKSKEGQRLIKEMFELDLVKNTVDR